MGKNNALPFVRRLVVYLARIVVLCMGVVLNTKTGLGTSAMSTISFAMQRIEGISLGTASVVIYSIFVVIQLVLARRIDAKVLVQIPVSLLFGVGIDFFDMVVFPGQAQGMLDGIPMLFSAIVLTALGVTLVVSANLVPVATDGLVKALSVLPLGVRKDQACLRCDLPLRNPRLFLRPCGLPCGNWPWDDSRGAAHGSLLCVVGKVARGTTC